MQAETLTRICPLCRRSADDENGAPGTRLCGECRAMLDPILPRAGFVQPDYAVALGGVATLASTSAQPLAHATDLDESAFSPAAGTDEDFELLSEDEEVAAPFNAQPMDNASAEATQTAFTQPFKPTVSEAFITPDQYEEPEVFIAPDQYEDDVESPPAAASFSPPVAPTYAEQVSNVAETTIDESASSVAAAQTAELSVEEAAAPADPWDDPLPAWEYSHSEWPLLVKDEPTAVASRLKWPIAAALVILAIAAATYFFFFKPRGEAPVTQQALTVPVGQSPPTAPPVASPTPEASATPATIEETKAAMPTPTNPAAEGQWKHALQAMASPNESEANAFAERLKTAAIPAYVVRAEVSGHVWYRVRVGRFTTIEEAQHYGAEARNRARAAGVALKDLQVTAYDKP
ncbi:MAG: SPOR domain-containing protein [Blastocatellia bacterium]